MLYLEERYHQIDPAEHQPEVHSMRFFWAGAESAAIEVLALIDWATEFLELSRSPIPEILAFLRRPFVVGKRVQFPIPEDPGDAIYKEKCVRTKAQKAWVYLCALLQFLTDVAMMESGEILYGGHSRITWASIAASTSWTQAHLYFGPPEREHFWTEPGPTSDLQNPLEAAVEERWETYLCEGVQETKDLSFTTLSWAGVTGKLQLPEARHPTEAESIPPGFTRLQRGTLEEQEAVSKYRTPPEDSQKQSLDEELGIQDVTNINKSWYPPTEAELVSAIKSIWDKSQPMDIDPAPAEHSMPHDDELELLGMAAGLDSPVTAGEDRVLDTPAGFSRALGDGRPTPKSSTGATGRRIMGRIE